MNPSYQAGNEYQRNHSCPYMAIGKFQGGLFGKNLYFLYNIGYFGNIINLPDFVVDIHQEISHFPILTENIEISDSEFVYEIRHI